MSKIAQALDALHASDPSGDLVSELDELLAHVGPSDTNDDSFRSAFRFFERHAACDLGSPGPLVHWLEKSFPRYIDALVESVNRRPTEYTLWMVNRILNANVNAQARSALVAALRSASLRTDVESSTSTSARDFLKAQAS